MIINNKNQKGKKIQVVVENMKIVRLNLNLSHANKFNRESLNRFKMLLLQLNKYLK
jgi:hypothetical protein